MSMDPSLLAKTLDELDPPAWAAPTYESYLVATCHRLRRRPIGEFGVEDLRIMIGQKIGLRFLVPLALDVVERDALVAGDLYPGDLLNSLLRLGPDFWRVHADWRNRVEGVLARLAVVPTELEDAAKTFGGWSG